MSSSTQVEIEQDKLDFEESAEEAKQIKETYFGANMDRFIDFFGNSQTIPTRILSMNKSQGSALLHACKLFRKQREQLVGENENTRKLKMSEHDEKVLEQLVSLVEESMNGLKQELGLSDENGFIVKLTSRSPKDITPNHPRTMKIYEEIMRRRGSDSCASSLDWKNEKLCALYFASLQCLRVYNAREAIELLSESSRIEYDLSLDLTFEDQFSLGIIVRPWDLNMKLESEFRGIVYNNELKCLSQYFTQCYLEPIGQHAALIERRCQEFFTNVVKPILSKNVPEMANYIIDFAICGENQEEAPVKLLEINPYLTTTGVGLFDWDTDRETLFENATAPFEFRILQKPVIGELLSKSGSLVKEWKELISNNH